MSESDRNNAGSNGFFPFLPGNALETIRRSTPILSLSCETPALLRALGQAMLSRPGKSDFETRLGTSLLAWAFSNNPFDIEAARILVRHSAANISAQAVIFLEFLVTFLSSGPDSLDWEQIKPLLSPQEALEMAGELVRDRRFGLYWLKELWPFALALDDPIIAENLLRETCLPAACASLRVRLLAELAYLFELPEARKRLQDLSADPGPDELFFPWSLSLLGNLEIHESGTNDSEALASLHALWKRMPWNVNLLLRLKALLDRPSPTLDPGPEDAVILLYSWNKPELLRETLISLSKSRTGSCPILVLDNGSDKTENGEDLMGAVLDFGADLFANRFRAIRVKTNLGAPAARNWLLTQPEVKRAAFAAFLDDDVLLPVNWLEELLAQGLARPLAGVIGCLVQGPEKAACIQAADFNILPLEMGESSFADLAERIFIFQNAGGLRDFGQFAYSRSCLSVSGCVHLVRTNTLDEVGGFDIRFSPTQFDDLERDLRLWSANRPGFYHGLVKVRHVGHSSLAKAASSAQIGQILGNKIKLEGLFDEARARNIFLENQKLQWQEIMEAYARVGCFSEQI